MPWCECFVGILDWIWPDNSPQTRLKRTLWRYGFRLCRTDGGLRGVLKDGNCQFSALSWGIHSTTQRHLEIRATVVNHLRGPDGADLAAFYGPEGTQPETFEEYLEYMSTKGTFGDHITLRAAADALGLRVRVVTADPLGNLEAPITDVSAQNQEDTNGKLKTVWLAFAAEHYSPIEPTAWTPKELLV